EGKSDKEGHTGQRQKAEGGRPKERQNGAGTPLEAVAKLRGAHKAPMPHVINPMLATLGDEPFDAEEWLDEWKFDGYRAVAFVEGGKVRLVSRNQNEFTHAYPELAAIANAVKGERVVLDGEICALDEEGRSSFSLMQQRTGLSGGEARKIRNSRPD